MRYALRPGICALAATPIPFPYTHTESATPMRRKHCEITDPAELERILAAATIGRMATVGPDGYPYITPVNFVFDRGCIYFHCALKGEKLDNIARDTRVCFEVDIPLAYIDLGLNAEGGACKLHQFYHCVVIRGEARLLPDGERKAAALNALVAKHEPGRTFTPVDAAMPACKACAVVEIKPRRMTGKGDLAQNKSEEERLAIARHLKKRAQGRDHETIAAMGFDPDKI
ncbi:MAG: pyridoxamine 5'-phosphate oxidase family protein [Desulfobacterales bacterium]|nr:pyridoxamine 5'-phosphate oxidase family protein [Desulfobacterales bacterium]